MLNRKKLLKYALLGALVIALGGYGIYRFTYVEPPTYMTALPSTRDIKQQVYATGTVAGKVEVDVGAQVSGQIQKLYVERGDRVKRGDLLCEIDPEIQQNDLRRAQAEEKLIAAQIASKEAQIKMLKSEHQRQQRLLKNDATTSQSAEQAEAEYEMALADLDALKAQYDQAVISVDDATTNLGYTRIVAPMDGTVYAIPVEEGQTVNANQTTPTILKLATLDTMTVEAEISEEKLLHFDDLLEEGKKLLNEGNSVFLDAEINPAGRREVAGGKELTAAGTAGEQSSADIYLPVCAFADGHDRGFVQSQHGAAQFDTVGGRRYCP